MSNKQEYGKTRLSDGHKKQLAEISASIIAVALSAGNPLAVAGATVTAGKAIYEFLKEKPDHDLCKKLAAQIDEIENPDPEVINHDIIEGILSAAAAKIQEQAAKNNLIPYRENPDALFHDIWNEKLMKDQKTENAKGYFQAVLRVISQNIQIGEQEMQSYLLLALPKDIRAGVELIIEKANQVQTAEL